MRTRESREARRHEHQVGKALAFQQCPGCAFDLATGEGERGCHYYECPYLPDLLDTTCPDCLYNFFTEEGNANCGDPPRCGFARDVAPERVQMMRTWLESHGHHWTLPS